MKMSKAKRKAYNQGKEDGKQIGYMEGYTKGLHDGNPFNAIIDACASIAKTIAENSELLQQLDQEEEIMKNENQRP